MNPRYYFDQLTQRVLQNNAATPTEKALAELMIQLAKELDRTNREIQQIRFELKSRG